MYFLQLICIISETCLRSRSLSNKMNAFIKKIIEHAHVHVRLKKERVIMREI